MKVYCVSVDVRAVAPVTEPSRVPPLLFRKSLTRGYITPEVEDFLSQTLNVIVAFAGMMPAVLGTPACVSKALIMYSFGATFLRFAELMAKDVAFGPSVSN